jgi:hypothetical protein
MVLAAGPRSHGFLGIQWLWGKGIVAPLVGMGGNFAIGGVTMFLEGQGSVLTVPYDVVSMEFRDGHPVMMIHYQGHRKRAHMTLRTGIDLPMGFLGRGGGTRSRSP